MYNAAKLAFAAAAIVIIATGPAYAYLDPGTGSILLQGLVAAVAGGIVATKLYWAKVKSFLSFGSKKDEGSKRQTGS